MGGRRFVAATAPPFRSPLAAGTRELLGYRRSDAARRPRDTRCRRPRPPVILPWPANHSPAGRTGLRLTRRRLARANEVLGYLGPVSELHSGQKAAAPTGSIPSTSPVRRAIHPRASLSLTRWHCSHTRISGASTLSFSAAPALPASWQPLPRPQVTGWPRRCTARGIGAQPARSADPPCPRTGTRAPGHSRAGEGRTRGPLTPPR